MSILDRLSKVDEVNGLPAHQFWAAFVGFQLGVLTENDLKAEWGVTGGSDLTEWNWLKASYDRALNKSLWLDALHAMAMLAEQDGRFDLRTKATAQAFMTAAETVP